MVAVGFDFYQSHVYIHGGDAKAYSAQRSQVGEPKVRRLAFAARRLEACPPGLVGFGIATAEDHPALQVGQVLFQAA